jgi:hypothetical protein
MQVLCLTFGDSTQASTFYRIHQYIPRLAAKGIHLEVVPARKFDGWKSISGYDAVLLQKTLLRTDKLRRLRRFSRRLLYDVDDAIWHPHGRKHSFFTNFRQSLRLKTIIRAADLCTVANDVLADYLKRWTSRVAIIPMALDEKQWTMRDQNANPKKVRIGWSGHPVNFPYLLQIEPALVEVQQRFPGTAEFAVFSGQKPEFKSLDFVHLPFVPGSEPEIIRSFDIGLLPLPDDAFSGAKAPIKGLQYLASGAAVVLSPVGAAAEMFRAGRTAALARSREEWVTALTTLIADTSLRYRLAVDGRKLFEEQFCLTANVPLVAAAFTRQEVV